MPPPSLPAHPGLVVLSEETVWNGRFPLQQIRFRHRCFNGQMSGVRTWELWRRGRAAAVLPFDPGADAVVLIEQFRLPVLAAGLDPVIVEIPAGLCDPDETPEQTIRREAVEETSLPLHRLLTIGDYVLSPGGSDERVSLFAGEVRIPATGADGIVTHAGLGSEHEDIRVRVWPARTAIEAAFAGRITNAVTAIALFWFATQHDTLQTLWNQK